MHRVAAGQLVHHNGVTRLVVSRQPAFLLRDHMAFLFRSGDDLDHRLVHILHGDELLVPAGCQQRALIGQVFQICAGEARGRTGKHVEIHILSQRLFPGVHP